MREQHARMTDQLWKLIHAERRALAADLAELTPEQWNAPSLCPGWTVHDVLAHLVSTAKLSPPAFLLGLAASGFNFNRFTAKRIAAEKAGGPAATLAAFRAVETSTSAPPGPKTSWLGEVLVHSEDIRRPLGIAHDYPTASVSAVTEFYASSNVLIGGKRRVSGVALEATDTAWSHGSGATVAGPARALMLATAGRKAVLDELAGPGVDILRSR
jgi:uncharacterized protein (TIGR03083 family)